MRRRNYLVVLTIVLIGIISYFILSKNKTQISGDISTISVKNTNPNTAVESLINDANQQLLTQSAFQPLTCAALDQANKVDTINKAAFISAKAIQWYFEGYDKEKIAETLAVTFDYSIAMQWLDTIKSLSSSHAKHGQLMQKIDSLDYKSNFLKSTMALKGISQYQVNSHYENNVDISHQFNQYPDLVIHHWNVALLNALENKNIEGVLTTIDELQKVIENPAFFLHPLKNINMLFSILSFTHQQSTIIIQALFDLSPVFIATANRSDRRLQQRLIDLGVDNYVGKFEFVNPDDFKVDPTINQLINTMKKEFSSLKQSPQADALCTEKEVIAALTKVNMAAFNSATAKGTMSSAWQGVSSILCPATEVLTGFFQVKNKLNAAEIHLDDLSDFNSIQKNSVELAQIIEQFNEYERAVLFNMLYMNKQFELEQVRQLIKREVTPSNSDFYLLLRQLPLAQQKELLIEYQYDFTHSNAADVSIITNAIQFGGDDELIPFLIEQGFPLKQNASSPDPLWMLLYILSGNYTEKVLPKKSISSLIDHTQLNEVHVNVMYKIKHKDSELYEKLIQAFPQLKFDDPKALIEISCG